MAQEGVADTVINGGRGTDECFIDAFDPAPTGCKTVYGPPMSPVGGSAWPPTGGYC